MSKIVGYAHLGSPVALYAWAYDCPCRRALVCDSEACPACGEVYAAPTGVLPVLVPRAEEPEEPKT